MTLLNLRLSEGALTVEIEERGGAAVVDFSGEAVPRISRRLRAAMRAAANDLEHTVTLHDADIEADGGYTVHARVILACGMADALLILRAALENLPQRAAKPAASAAPPQKRRPTHSTPHIYSRSRRHAA